MTNKHGVSGSYTHALATLPLMHMWSLTLQVLQTFEKNGFLYLFYTMEKYKKEIFKRELEGGGFGERSKGREKTIK